MQRHNTHGGDAEIHTFDHDHEQDRRRLWQRIEAGMASIDARRRRRAWMALCGGGFTFVAAFGLIELARGLA
jgi:hypothetical protein